MNADQWTELQDDERFKAIRHRFYKLGTERRSKVLAHMGFSQPPGLKNYREIQDAERRTLFEIAFEKRLSELEWLIEGQEIEIEAKNKAKNQ